MLTGGIYRSQNTPKQRSSATRNATIRLINANGTSSKSGKKRKSPKICATANQPALCGATIANNDITNTTGGYASIAPRKGRQPPPTVVTVCRS